tara:strand:+ start:25543 stop:25689 length:147 start_codon:yes stop_codon:yes gene_type:complete
MKKLFLLTIILFTVAACAETKSTNSRSFPNYEALGEPTFRLPSLKKIF